jgi:hypothetical protein
LVHGAGTRAIDEEMLEPVKTLAAKFKDEIVPPPLSHKKVLDEVPV